MKKRLAPALPTQMVLLIVFIAATKLTTVEAAETALTSCLSVGRNPADRVANCSTILAASPSRAIAVKALNSRALAFTALKNYAGAVADLTRLIGISPNVAAYYDNRQAAYRGLGNLDAALADATTAVALAPNHAFVHHSRASVLVQMGRPSEAMNDYERAIQIDPKPSFRYLDAAAALATLGRNQEAVAMLDRGLAISPETDELLKSRGVALAALGRDDEAIADLVKYRTREPGDPSINAVLAGLQGKAGGTPIAEPKPVQPSFDRQAPPLKSVSFGSFHVDANRPAVIVFDGPIDEGAPLDFRRALSADPAANTLELNSPGGLVTMGLLVADDVFQRHMSTIIPAGNRCFSACSFVFFAGASRIAVGELGVHQVAGSDDIKDAQLRISDILDQLTRFGTPQQVFSIMFRTLPEDIHVFTDDEIASYGINRSATGVASVNVAPVAPASSSSAIDGPSPGDASVENERRYGDEANARAFLDAYLSAWSQDNGAALAFMDRAYSSSVLFYGVQKSGPSVFDEKRKFALRWPARSYRLHSNDVSVDCFQKRCSIKSVIDWFVSSDARRKTSTGVAELDLVWDARTNQIVSEGGMVLKGVKPIDTVGQSR